MKLYNLFEQVILEEIGKHKRIISEGVSRNEIDIAINGDEKGRHFHVSFDYLGEDNVVMNRWVQVYDYTKTTKDNPAISGYEISSTGGNGYSKRPGWKIYLLDKMSNFKISKVPFYEPISDVNPNVKGTFNTTGNNTPTLKGFISKAKFGYEYKPSTIKNDQNKVKKGEMNLTRAANRITGKPQQKSQVAQPNKPLPLQEPETPEIEDNNELNK